MKKFEDWLYAFLWLAIMSAALLILLRWLKGH